MQVLLSNVSLRRKPHMYQLYTTKHEYYNILVFFLYYLCTFTYITYIVIVVINLVWNISHSVLEKSDKKRYE